MTARSHGIGAAALALALTLAIVPAAFAQKTGPNGGLVAGETGHETELVVAPGEVTVYLLHENKAQPTKNASLRIVVQQGGSNATVPLTDAGDRLVGKLETPLSPGAIVVITGKDDHGHAVSARYVIK